MLSAAIGIGCNASSDLPLIGPVISGNAVEALSIDRSTWNAFEVDVDITVFGSNLKSSLNENFNRGVSYRLTRRRGKLNNWITVQEFGELLPQFKGATNGIGVPAIVRSIDPGDGSPVQFVDARGQTVKIPNVSQSTLPTHGDVRGRVLSPPLPVVPHTRSEADVRALDTSSAWLDRFITTPSSTQRESTTL